ncbi:MAG: TIGR04211 family SH3 domain-containing protein [Gammaproteobacteria bacterium]|nr:TIGR04211 family SH3 domain-containing protein [Gammaproteobacteria bacterium]MDH5302980.1 TIGR04211 family SH3 domain-containing protein [Gammaproteobacteria bacterium]MDH5321273.1 TIGR04211 family SH3 domain-containing protein [Gammaproteobacteria bacterium]
MIFRIRFVLFGLPALLAAVAAAADDAWVSDQFEVMLRTGPSTSNAIERMLPSGTALEVLENDAESGYSRVRTAGGTEGWVLSRYLMNEPSAREQLERLSSRLSNATATGSSLTSQLNAVKDEYDEATSRISSLEREKLALEQELAAIKRTAANALALDSQNKELQQQLATVDIEIATLEQRNRELSSQTTRYWFVSGAGVLLGGMLLGLWLPRIKWRRPSRYDRF